MTRWKEQPAGGGGTPRSAMHKMHCRTERGLHINSCKPEAVAEQARISVAWASSVCTRHGAHWIQGQDVSTSAGSSVSQPSGGHRRGPEPRKRGAEHLHRRAAAGGAPTPHRRPGQQPVRQPRGACTFLSDLAYCAAAEDPSRDRPAASASGQTRVPSIVVSSCATKWGHADCARFGCLIARRCVCMERADFSASGRQAVLLLLTTTMHERTPCHDVCRRCLRASCRGWSSMSTL